MFHTGEYILRLALQVNTLMLPCCHLQHFGSASVPKWPHAQVISEHHNFPGHHAPRPACMHTCTSDVYVTPFLKILAMSL